jgi:hypothetical protein
MPYGELKHAVVRELFQMFKNVKITNIKHNSSLRVKAACFDLN